MQMHNSPNPDNYPRMFVQKNVMGSLGQILLHSLKLRHLKIVDKKIKEIVLLFVILFLTR